MHFQEQNEYLAKKYDKSNDFGLPLDLVHYISTAQVMDMIWTVINSQPKPKIVVLDCFF